MDTNLTTPGNAGGTQSDGDASVHLEDLVAGALPDLPGWSATAAATGIELIGPHLRLSGAISTGYHRRLSDFLNHHEGLLRIEGVTILRRNGDPTKVTTPSMWASPAEVTLVAATGGSDASDGSAPQDITAPFSPDLAVQKVTHTLVVVTSGHTLTGNVHIPAAAELSVFIESNDPPFIPLTDVRTRSLADRRIISRYAFALLNRRHIVAATALQPGMIVGRNVL